MQKITPCLWFDSEAEEAAKFYTSVFKDSKMGRISYYGEENEETSGKPAGSVMTVEFELNGQNFMGLNGGPIFKFTEAVSFMINCKDQEEIDYYWEKLTADGGEESQCGWLKDKYGVSWQVFSMEFEKLMTSRENPEKSRRAMEAMLTMRKLDIAALKKAYNGE